MSSDTPGEPNMAPQSPRSRQSPCEVSLTTLVLGEISQVTSMMRKNARWAGSSNLSHNGSGGNNISAMSAGLLAVEDDKAGLAKELGLRGSKSRDKLKTTTNITTEQTTAASSSEMKSPGTNRDRNSRNSAASMNKPAASLLSGFAALRNDLTDVEDVRNLDAVRLLTPFLDVVRSGDTSGPITAIALSSVDKFITYGLVHKGSPNLAQAMTAVAGAGTHCKFEASDSVSDEVVLLKILDVLKDTLTSDLGDVLSDEAVCEMMETGLSMCCQMRLSEMLRRSAERTMQAMLVSVFQKLHDIPTSAEEAEIRATAARASTNDGAQTPNEEQQLRMNAPDPTSGSIPAASTSNDECPIFTRTPSFINTASLLSPSTPISPRIGTFEIDQDEQAEIRSYGLPSIREILRVLISLLNPHDQQHTDSMRLMALGLLNVAFEIGGRSIGRFPSLRVVVADGLCKYLFQLARSENPVLLSTTMRVVSNVFDTMREHLKLQQELFISFLVDRLVRPVGNASVHGRKGEMESELDATTWNIDDNTSAAVTPIKNSHLLSPQGERRSSGNLTQSVGPNPSHARYQPLPGSESRDLMLEYLVQFARAPDFMTNLWINYDCNVDCEDLFERLIKFFSRGVYPAQPNGPYLQDNSQLLCLDTLLTFVNHLSSRLEPQNDGRKPPVDPSSLAQAKAGKRTLLEGIIRFNEKPKNGIAFLESKGLIYTSENHDLPRHEVLAKFLKTCPRLDKRELGDYISRPDNIQILRSFIEQFNFKGKFISEALRDLLEAFRLPGESQQIDRITETFASVYVTANPEGEIHTADAAYVLAFSIIMLNTDLHSPQVRKRMTVEDYARNLKGVNDNKDFAPEYIKGIYDNIRKREIIMPQEHVGQLGFEFAWKELLHRARTAGPFLICETHDFDKAMFTLAWKPVISALSYAFTHFMDDYMLQRAISGFQQCAALANPGLPEVFDYTIRSLVKITGLLSSSLPAEASTNFPTVDIDGQTVTISPLALRFGTSFKSQLAAVVLFSIANDHAALISSSWIDVGFRPLDQPMNTKAITLQIFEVYQTLFTYSLLPQSLVNTREFLAGAPAIPLKVRVQQTVPEEKRRNDGGLFSTLSSYLLSPYAQGPDGIGRDVTDDDIEHALSTIDCVASCRVDVLYKTIITLPPQPLGDAIRCMVDLNERLTLDKVRNRSILTPQGSGPPSPASGRAQVPYDASVVFMLELMMSIAGEAEHAIHETWPVIFEFTQKLLAAASSFHHILLERSVTGLLRLASVVAKRDDMRDQVFLALDSLRTLPQGMLAVVSDQVAAGLSLIVSENPTVVRSATEWNLVFSLWSGTAAREEAASTTFGLISQLATRKVAGGLQADNFVGFIGVLNDFASAAGQGDVKYRNSPAGQNDPVAVRGRQALEMIRESQSLANELIEKSELPPARAWETYWLPVLSAYSQQSVNGCREIRQTALANLQRTLIANEVLSNADIDLTMVFERLIFPMLDELLKPQVFRRDPEGMGETRLRASALLCKIFLHYLVQLSEKQGIAGMTELWLKILGYLDRFMHSGRRDQMYEAVPESLKNVLLVMHASGFLVPPHQARSEDQSALWDATFDRLDIFLPSLRQDVFPTPVSQRASQLALQPQPARSPSASPSLRPVAEMNGAESAAPSRSMDSPSQSLNVYL